MKKNVVAPHMTAPKESAKSRFRRLDILPRLLCLLLALVLWLVIVNTQDLNKDSDPGDASAVQSETVNRGSL